MSKVFGAKTLALLRVAANNNATPNELSRSRMSASLSVYDSRTIHETHTFSRTGGCVYEPATLVSIRRMGSCQRHSLSPGR